MSIKTKELTLTRALVELKLYDSKIQKAIDELKPVSYSVNNVVTDYRQTPNEFIGEYKSQMQKIKDLRNNKTLLKNALMKANATTKVTIADKVTFVFYILIYSFISIWSNLYIFNSYFI